MMMMLPVTFWPLCHHNGAWLYNTSPQCRFGQQRTLNQRVCVCHYRSLPAKLRRSVYGQSLHRHTLAFRCLKLFFVLCCRVCVCLKCVSVCHLPAVLRSLWFFIPSLPSSSFVIFSIIPLLSLPSSHPLSFHSSLLLFLIFFPFPACLSSSLLTSYHRFTFAVFLISPSSPPSPPDYFYLFASFIFLPCLFFSFDTVGWGGVRHCFPIFLQSLIHPLHLVKSDRSIS